MGEKATFKSAVNIILRKNGKILLQRRKNTKLWSGFLALPTGHIDVGENPYEAMIREAREELGIEITEKQLVNPSVLQCNWVDGKTQYYDVYFDLVDCDQEPRNMEPDECSELIWVDENNLPEDMVPFKREAIEKRKAGINFFVTTCSQEKDIQNLNKLKRNEREIEENER